MMPDKNLAFYESIPSEMPRTRPTILSGFFRWLYSAIGWGFSGDVPQISKVVIILVPHTSNWDFFIAMLAKFSLQLRASYMMKREAFFWPFKNLLINIGGIPINRRNPSEVVLQAAASFKRDQGNWLVITPEGTRKKVDRFKTGFLRIAKEAGVPVVVAGFDYQKKAIVFSKVFQPTDDFEKDADELYHFCRTTFVGKRPENQ